jgi:hypothetical protein
VDLSGGAMAGDDLLDRKISGASHITASIVEQGGMGGKELP